MELGSHEELLAQGGPYARLYRLQFEVAEALVEPAAGAFSRAPVEASGRTPV